MDGTTFHRLARAVGAGSSRRRLLGVLTGLGLGGALAMLEGDDAAAEKPGDRLRRRKQQHRRKRRNAKRRNNGKNGNNHKNKGGLGSGGTAILQSGSTVTLNDPTNCASAAVAGCTG
jgi:hypothetical protein